MTNKLKGLATINCLLVPLAIQKVQLCASYSETMCKMLTFTWQQNFCTLKCPGEIDAEQGGVCT